MGIDLVDVSKEKRSVAVSNTTNVFTGLVSGLVVPSTLEFEKNLFVLFRVIRGSLFGLIKKPSTNHTK